MSRWPVALAMLCACFGTPQQPVFRAGTLIVPIDVRVIDEKGLAVTGLTQRDFTVFEDERPQDIRQFSSVALTGDAAPQPLIRMAPTASPAAQNRRIFLIMLGTNAHNRGFKTTADLAGFVRTQLLPQDYVAVYAYNRATDFTTDRDLVASILERYAVREGNINLALIGDRPSYLASPYGLINVKPKVQADIDWIFDVPGAPKSRTLPYAAVPDSDRLRRDERTAIGAGTGGGDQQLVDVGFTDFLSGFTETIEDLSNLYRGIEYLRHIDGEKHLLFVVGQPMQLPRFEDDGNLTRVAADARVAIDTIQTGGIPNTRVGELPTFAHRFAVQSVHFIAEETGGQASIYAYARDGLQRIAETTKDGYLLGYASSNTNWDGRYRRITVKVNRPGVNLLYRHGYFGRRELTPFDRRATTTFTRLAGAKNMPGDVKDIQFKLDAKAEREGNAWIATVDLQIKPERLTWTAEGDDRIAEIDIAVFLGAAEGAVAEHRERVKVRLTPQQFEHAKAAGLSSWVRVRLSHLPKDVKVVVYDYGADLLGTASMRVR